MWSKGFEANQYSPAGQLQGEYAFMNGSRGDITDGERRTGAERVGRRLSHFNSDPTMTWLASRATSRRLISIPRVRLSECKIFVWHGPHFEPRAS